MTEEVVEGHGVGATANPKVEGGNEGGDGIEDDNMPDAVNFDMENANDGDKAQEHARSIRVEFDLSDVKFWFQQLEGEMLMASVKSQWLKRTILQRNLPNKQKEDIKSYLTLEKADAGNNIYLT